MEGMLPAIITLLAGIVIVVISFFVADGRGKNTEDELADGGKEKLEKELDEYCSSLLEKKRIELEKQGETVKADMQKSFDELIESVGKRLSDIKEENARELDGLTESSKKAVDDCLSGIEDAKKKLQDELDACEKQLSEKAKKQMIDYINKSLSDAYSSYDPDDKSEKEAITYEEPEKKVEEKAEAEPEAEPGTEPEKKNEENIEPEEGKSPETESEHAAYADEPVTDSAFPVVESSEAKPEGQAKPSGSRQRRKKKKKQEPKKPVEIWDDGGDVEPKVLELHKKGMSIMEIANALGIGVGEARVIIDKTNEADKQ